MGVIRKTASIGTLGLIRFRSKAERLERANAELDRAQRRLVAATAAAETSKDRARRAERRARKAEARAGLMAQRQRTRRWGRKRLAGIANAASEAASTAANAVTPG